MFLCFIIYPIFKKDLVVKVGNGFGKYSNNTIDSIWGNSSDGLSGDAPYRSKEAKVFFRRFAPNFWWSVIRNPAGNFKRSLCNGIITSVSIHGCLKVATINNKKYFFYFTSSKLLMFKIGYKIWDEYKVGDNINAKLGFSLQRGNNKGDK